jgi:hypothetical protein
MKSDGTQPNAPRTETAESEQETKRRHASELLQDERSSFLVRAWYEYEGTPYGESEEALLRWTQEQLDKMHPE